MAAQSHVECGWHPHKTEWFETYLQVKGESYFLKTKPKVIKRWKKIYIYTTKQSPTPSNSSCTIKKHIETLRPTGN